MDKVQIWEYNVQYKIHKGGVAMFMNKFYYYYFAMGCPTFVKSEK